MRARARAEVDGKLNAVVRPADLAPSGQDRAGPFAGVPFLIKDLGQDYAGLPTAAAAARSRACRCRRARDRRRSAGSTPAW